MTSYDRRATDRPRARTAVIPAAGFGTRFLPFTKAVPKEMLPVVDRPAIEYIVEEAARAGLADVLLITSRAKKALEDHFDVVAELETALLRKGDHAKLHLARYPQELARIHTVRQGEALGLGHAVLCAAGHVREEPFAVLLGDDIIDERDHLLSYMIDVQQEHGGAVVALQQVPADHIHLYGCAAVEPTGTTDLVRITGLVEKPAIADAPSDLAIIGRYVLPGEIMDVLRGTRPGRGGEIQLTDALQTLAATGTPVHGVVFRGRRYDTGDRGEYLRTVVALAAERPDLGPSFRGWLREFVAGLPAE